MRNKKVYRTLGQRQDLAVGAEQKKKAAGKPGTKESEGDGRSETAPPHIFAVCAYQESPYLAECLKSLLAQTKKSGIVVCTSTPSAFLTKLCQKYGLPLSVREGKSSLWADWNFAAETAVQTAMGETQAQDGEDPAEAGVKKQQIAIGETQAEDGGDPAKAGTEKLQTAERKPGKVLVTIAHQDDRYHKEYTAELLSAYRKWPDLKLFCTRYRTINAFGRTEQGIGRAERVKRILRLPLRIPGLCGRTFWKRLSLRFGNAIGCPTCTYALTEEDLPLFRKPYAFVIDWDTLWRLSGEPGRFICRERELMDYRVHSGAATMVNIVNHNREKEETEMFRRMWPKPVAGVLMHFYKKSYQAYGQED